MDSTLSTFKKSYLYFMLIFLGMGCSRPQISKPIVSEKKDILQTPIPMGPSKASSVFIDKTKEYGLENLKAVHLYAVDFNDDGFTDLVALEDFYSPPIFYKFNDKTRKFELQPSPFDTLVRASYLNFVDLDRDGLLDLIAGTLNQKTAVTQYPARIFKGQKENGNLHYQEKAVLPTGLLPTAGISAIDFDLDGNLDLFLSNWFSYKDSNPQPVNDLLLKGDGFNFSDVSMNLKSEFDFNKSIKQFINATPTFGSSVCDIDQNGFPDLLTSTSNGYFNKLWMNIDGLNFVNYGVESSYGGDDEGSAETKGGGNSFFSLCGDYNTDGIVDIATGTLSKDSDPETRDRSSMLTGTTHSFPPKFIRSEFYRSDNIKKWSEGDRRGVWIDYNLDGLIDLLVDNSGFPPDSRLVFFEQQKDHAYEDRAKDLGIDIVNPSGTVSIDLNHDGIMDFVTGQSKVRAGENINRVYAFENQTKRSNKGSVRFHLRGLKSNFFGISSSVWLKTNKHNYFANVEYNSGSLPSQNEEGIYFAYDKEMPLSLEIKWSFANKDRLGRPTPISKKISLKGLNLKGSHHELIVCEDGKIKKFPGKCN